MLNRYRNPDELPTEGFGFDDWIREQEGGEERNHSFEYKRSGPITSTSGEHSYEFFEADDGHGPCFKIIYGKITSVSDGTTIGVLCADFIVRGRVGIYGMCDDRSQELIDTARLVVNNDGTLRKRLKKAIADPARIDAASRGGLLFLDEVHILRAYRGQDLALEFVTSLLSYLGRRWSLAVSTIVPWDHADQQHDETHERSDEERERLARHFARLGFKQLHKGTWYLERSQLPSPPLTREAVASLEVELEPKLLKPIEISEQDKELQSLAERASFDRQESATTGLDPDTALKEMTALLKAGASISASRALHFSVGASKFGKWTPLSCQFLVANGADVNLGDENGDTALHTAATASSEAAVRCLLELGADPLIKNHRGSTPLDQHTKGVTADIQSLVDFEACNAARWRNLGIPEREPAAAGQAKRHLPCSLLLQRATASRKAQLPHRECLVKCLMYYEGFSADVLRKIYAAVAPPMVADYPPLSPGQLPSGSFAMLGALNKAELNGLPGTIIGWDSTAERYMFKPADARRAAIKVKPENVLPQTRIIEASDEGDGDSDEDDYSDDYGEDGTDMSDW